MATMTWEKMIADMKPIISWADECDDEIVSHIPPPIVITKKIEVIHVQSTEDPKLICPNCGGKKGINYDCCYNCNSIKYTCPKCNGKKSPMYELCVQCAFS